jgi:hypothetical protein
MDHQHGKPFNRKQGAGFDTVALPPCSLSSLLNPQFRAVQTQDDELVDGFPQLTPPNAPTCGTLPELASAGRRLHQKSI